MTALIFQKGVAQSFLQILGSEYVLLSGDFRPGKKQTPRHRSDGARRCVMMAKVTDVSSIDDVNNEQAI